MLRLALRYGLPVVVSVDRENLYLAVERDETEVEDESFSLVVDRRLVRELASLLIRSIEEDLR